MYQGLSDNALNSLPLITEKTRKNKKKLTNMEPINRTDSYYQNIQQ